MVAFLKNSGGGAGKVLNWPCILEETRLLEKYSRVFIEYACFSHEKGLQEIES